MRVADGFVVGEHGKRAVELRRDARAVQQVASLGADRIRLLPERSMRFRPARRRQPA
jgi:hypothetical protein